jgi:phenylacetate-coenzyme A ligase PaaK-like adenylate-forming protein
MTQSHLDSLSYEIIQEGKDYDKNIVLDSVKIKTEDIKKEKNNIFEEKEQNLIRKVEMNLSSDTDIHIYENKFKIIVKKQVPFYMSKKTWNLLLSKYETINTASKLTEL